MPRLRLVPLLSALALVVAVRPARAQAVGGSVSTPVTGVPTPTPTAPPTLALAPTPVGATLSAVPADTGRPRAVTYSDAYGTRLTIHRYASYATLPVFAAEYVLGDRLIRAQDRGQPVPGGVKSAHTAVALALGGLFAANTVTGAWNWWDARHDPNGRTRRTVHAALMLAADAGFAAAGALAGNAGSGRSGASVHRNVALASMGVSVAGGAMMYLWKD